MINVSMKSRTKQAARDAGFAAGLYDMDPTDKELTEARRFRLAEIYATGKRFAELAGGPDPRQQAIADLFMEGYSAGCVTRESPIRVLVRHARGSPAYTIARELQLETC
jgi:hypothetical protein